jgi:hypothetical protein
MTSPAPGQVRFAVPRCRRRGQVAVLLTLLVMVPIALVGVSASEAWATPVDRIDCREPLLKNTHVDTIFEVRAHGVDLPLVTIKETYKIPASWSGADSLLDERDTPRHDDALRCIMVDWRGYDSYRLKEPTISLVNAGRSRSKIQGTVEIQDQFLVELYGTKSLRAGSWIIDSTTKDVRIAIVEAGDTFEGVTLPAQLYDFGRTISIELSGAKLKLTNTWPISSDNWTGASWELANDVEVRDWSVEAGLGTRKKIALSSGSGVGRVVSETSSRLAEAAFYILLLLLVRRQRTSRDRETASRTAQHLRPIVLMAALGLAGLAAGFLPYMFDRDFTEETVPGAYWPGGALTSSLFLASILVVLCIWSRRFMPMLVLIPSVGLGSLLIFGPPQFHEATAGELAPAAWLLGLSTLLTWTLVLGVGLAAQQIRRNSKVDVRNSRPPSASWALPITTVLVAVFIVFGWVWQQKHAWDRNNLFPTSYQNRTREFSQSLTSSLMQYPRDLLSEFNGVFWFVSVLSVVHVLIRSTPVNALRPTRNQNLLICAALPYSLYASTWYVGLWVPLPLLLGFVILVVVLPRIGRRNLLSSAVVCSQEPRMGSQQTCGLETKITGLSSLRRDLVGAQAKLQTARLAVKALDEKLATGEIGIVEHHAKVDEIEKARHDYRSFPPEPAVEEPAGRSGIVRWFTARRPTSARVWMLQDNVTPGDVAISIGPGDSWAENGKRAAQVMLILSIPAVAYFVWLATRPGQWADPTYYFGSLHIVEAIGSEVFLWAAAGFFFGCLWTTLPGRRGAIKGLVFALIAAVPEVVDHALTVLLDQSADRSWMPRVLAMVVLFILLGVVFDLQTMRAKDPLGLLSWRPLLSMYGMRKPLAAVVVVIPILTSVVGIYFQLRDGFSGNSTSLPDRHR